MRDSSIDLQVLESIGLTKSEIKVYSSLLELGTNTVGPIISRSQIASSKVYELLDKLILKGLVTKHKEQGITYFKAANPRRLLNYMDSKKRQLNEKEVKLKELMPQLELKFSEHLHESEVELFKGFKGLKTAFNDMIDELEEGEEFLVMGGGGEDHPSTKTFFENIHRKRSEKGIIQRILMPESRRAMYKDLMKFPNTISKFVNYGMPATINVYKKVVIISVLSSPLAIRIRDKKVADSYKLYFEIMWSDAKE